MQNLQNDDCGGLSENDRTHIACMRDFAIL